MHTDLRRMLRIRYGRDPDPSLAIVDTQSVTTTAVGGDVGFDAGKQVDGRTRHILVDTRGLLLVVVVTAASLHDASSAPVLTPRLRDQFPRLQKVIADAGYKQPCVAWFARTTGWLGKIVCRAAHVLGVPVLPNRWLGERTLAPKGPRSICPGGAPTPTCRAGKAWSTSRRVTRKRCTQQPLTGCNEVLNGV